MIAFPGSFPARTVSLDRRGRERRRTNPAAGPARSRAPANNVFRGSDGGSLRRWQDKGSCGVVTCGRRPIGERQTKGPLRMAPRGLSTVLAMLVLYP
jgi:hypothetical protein